jgi:hypothetical protein
MAIEHPDQAARMAAALAEIERLQGEIIIMRNRISEADRSHVAQVALKKLATQVRLLRFNQAEGETRADFIGRAIDCMASEQGSR